MESTRDSLAALVRDPSAFLGHADVVLRRIAVSSLSGSQIETHAGTLMQLCEDADTTVRAAAAERIGAVGEVAMEPLGRLIDDPEPTVREAVATAYGEVKSAEAIPWLVDAANHDPDRAVREAAVASLGAIGDDAAIDPLLSLLRDGQPQVRRRAVAALTVFDDERIEPALERAALDRNPGVREAAEMVVGRQLR